MPQLSGPTNCSPTHNAASFHNCLLIFPLTCLIVVLPPRPCHAAHPSLTISPSSPQLSCALSACARTRRRTSTPASHRFPASLSRHGNATKTSGQSTPIVSPSLPLIAPSPSAPSSPASRAATHSSSLP